MEKLIKKFESIITLYPGSNIPGPNYPKTTIGERVTIECKKVAIAFCCYYRIVLDAYDNEPNGTIGELFDKFIKEEYGRE